MRIGLTSVYVDDRERVLRSYIDVLGFAKKAAGTAYCSTLVRSSQATPTGTATVALSTG